MTAPKISPDRWMEQLRYKIGDMPLCELPMPGSHDSASYGDYHGAGTAQTQSKTIKEQLELGIRYFDFRVMVNGGVYYAHHTVPTNNDYTNVKPDLPEAGIFKDIKDFLEPRREVIIMNLWDFKGHIGQDFNDQDHEKFRTHIKEIFGRMLIPSKRGPSVTLNTLAEDQKIIVIYGDGYQGDDLLWPNTTISAPYWPECGGPKFSTISKTPWSKEHRIAFFSFLEHAIRGRRGNQDSQFHVVQGVFAYTAEVIAAGAVVSDATGFFASVMDLGASILNPYVVDLFTEWISDPTLKPNILMTDSVDRGQVAQKIIDTLCRDNFPSPKKEGSTCWIMNINSGYYLLPTDGGGDERHKEVGTYKLPNELAGENSWGFRWLLKPTKEEDFYLIINQRNGRALMAENCGLAPFEDSHVFSDPLHQTDCETMEVFYWRQEHKGFFDLGTGRFHEKSEDESWQPVYAFQNKVSQRYLLAFDWGNDRSEPGSAEVFHYEISNLNGNPDNIKGFYWILQKAA